MATASLDSVWKTVPKYNRIIFWKPLRTSPRTSAKVNRTANKSTFLNFIIIKLKVHASLILHGWNKVFKYNTSGLDWLNCKICGIHVSIAHYHLFLQKIRTILPACQVKKIIVFVLTQIVVDHDPSLTNVLNQVMIKREKYQFSETTYILLI